MVPLTESEDACLSHMLTGSHLIPAESKVSLVHILEERKNEGKEESGKKGRLKNLSLFRALNANSNVVIKHCASFRHKYKERRPAPQGRKMTKGTPSFLSYKAARLRRDKATLEVALVYPSPSFAGWD